MPNSDEIVIESSALSKPLILSRTELHRKWARTSYEMQKLRDDSECARQEYAGLLNKKDKGLFYQLTFDHTQMQLPRELVEIKPRVAILREQGVNGQREMAYAFMRAGFIAVDMHMSDLISGERKLSDFVGVAACGGFSYGDVLGAGSGWAKSILFNK